MFGTDGIPTEQENELEAQQIAATRGQVKKGEFNPFWDGRKIPIEDLQDQLVQSVYMGKMDPISATMAVGVAERARQNGTGPATPASLAGAAGRTMIQGGVGAGMGYALGKVVGAVGGAFGMLSPAAQESAGRTGALVGLIGNILSGSRAFSGGMR